MPLNMEMVDELVAHLHERERIRIKKDAGEPRPWTTDGPLSTYSFTNVLRSDDYTTRWLVKNWYEPNHNQPLEILLLNAGIARYFGRVEFLEALGFSTEWEPERIRDLAEEWMSQGWKVFTSAYVITNGGISDAKYNVVLDHYLDGLNDHVGILAKKAEETRSWQKIGEYMMSNLEGFGGTGFMTKEVLQDFILATKNRIQWNDLYEWTPVGPGAVKGLNWLYDRDVRTKLNKKQALQELKEVAAALAPRMESWMPQWGGEFDLHAVQFATCEFQKRCRVVHLGERMKNNYRPRIKQLA